jgi:hypothetical protein
VHFTGGAMGELSQAFTVLPRSPGRCVAPRPGDPQIHRIVEILNRATGHQNLRDQTA